MAEEAKGEGVSEASMALLRASNDGDVAGVEAAMAAGADKEARAPKVDGWGPSAEVSRLHEHPAVPAPGCGVLPVCVTHPACMLTSAVKDGANAGSLERAREGGGDASLESGGDPSPEMCKDSCPDGREDPCLEG